MAMRWRNSRCSHVSEILQMVSSIFLADAAPLKLKARKNFNLLPVRHIEASHYRVCYTTSLGTLRNVNSYIKTVTTRGKGDREKVVEAYACARVSTAE